MTPSWASAKRVLCVRLDNMGDVLMTTPALRALAEALPGRELVLLASASGALAARHIPQISEVIRYDAPWVKHMAAPSPAADMRMITELQQQAFDAAVIFTVYSQSALPAALMCRLAGIPLRLAHSRENPYELLTHWVQDTEPQGGVRHEVQRQLDLVATVGAQTVQRRLSFEVFQEDRAQLLRKLDAAGVDADRPWVVIHAGATAASRRYPAERFASVARGLIAQLDCQVLFTGDSGERVLTEMLRRATGPGAFSLAGHFELGEFGALIEQAAVLVSNNTGPVHIASALCTPVVDLYALTNPQHTPWEVPNRVLFHDVACKYCYKSSCPQGHHDCLRRVEPEEVVAAATALWHAHYATDREALVPHPMDSHEPVYSEAQPVWAQGVA